MARTNARRTGFTLTELLVALAVIIVLGAIGAAVVPNVVARDRTTDGTAIVRQYLMIAKNRAARDNLPRGLRFIISADPTVPTKLNTWSTEIIEIEAPEVFVPNLLGLTRSNTYVPPVLPAGGVGAATVQPAANPYVQVVYTLYTDPMTPNDPRNGQIINRRIFICKLSQDQANDIRAGALLGVPEFNGYWARIWSVTQNSSPPPISPASTPPATNPTTVDIELELIDVTGYQRQNPATGPTAVVPTTFPDDYMGASTSALSYRFGIYSAPQPLLAAQVVPLPKNICVDLTQGTATTDAPSRPPYNPVTIGTPDYDILFAPNGQVINGFGRPAIDGQLFLWVRDYTKAASPLVITGTTPAPVRNIYDLNVFRTAGDQQIVGLKAKSGSLGVFPVTWPQEGGATPGAYAPGTDPYTFARQGATGP